MRSKELAYQVLRGIFDRSSCLKPIGREAELFRKYRIQDNVGACDAVAGADHAELELVAGEGEGRGAISVGHIGIEIRERVYMSLQALSGNRAARAAGLNDLRDNVLELGAEKTGDDGGRRLIRAEAVVIADIRRREPQQIRVGVHGRKYAGKSQKKELILVRALTGIQEV